MQVAESTEDKCGANRQAARLAACPSDLRTTCDELLSASSSRAKAKPLLEVADSGQWGGFAWKFRPCFCTRRRKLLRNKSTKKSRTSCADGCSCYCFPGGCTPLTKLLGSRVDRMREIILGGRQQEVSELFAAACRIVFHSMYPRQKAPIKPRQSRLYRAVLKYFAFPYWTSDILVVGLDRLVNRRQRT